MKKKNEPLILRSIYLPASLDEQLRKLALDAECSKNALIVACLEEHALLKD